MRHLKVLLILAAVVMSAGAAQAKMVAASLERTVDSYMYLIDNSGSMMMNSKITGIKKMEMAKMAAVKVESNVPYLGYQNAVNLFSPNAIVAPAADRDIVAVSNAINAIENDAKVYRRFTEMGDSLAQTAQVVSAMKGPKAVFFISDGKETDGSMTPAQAAQALYNANPDMVMHVISVADTAEGVENLNAVAALNPNSQLIDATVLLGSDELAYQFTKSAVFNYNYAMKTVFFAVGSYRITPAYAAKLDKLICCVGIHPGAVLYIQASADPTGSTESNQILSDNRANAVKNYLVKGGLNPEQISAVGIGETDMFPTYPEDRRADIHIRLRAKGNAHE